CQAIEDRARCLSRCDLGVRLSEVVAQSGNGGVEARWKLHPLAPQEFTAALGRERLQARFPGPADGFTALASLPPGRADIAWNDDGWVGPPQPLTRRIDLGGPERSTVRGGGAGLGRRAKGDHRTAGDQVWPVAFVGALDRGRDRVGVMAVDTLG